MLALAPLLVTALFPSLPATVGRISFPIGCGAAAQARFTRGVSALHSFWYDEARSEFQAAEKAEPRCAMAYWGEAMSYLEILWLSDDVSAARAALARMPSPPASPREQAWMAALRALVGDGDLWPRRAAFAQAMEQMHAQFPDDDEVKAWLALALLVETPEPQLGLQARAAALAFEVTAKNPDHPGALHYAIHALDTPELAPLGLPAARRYAQIAPEAPHARHMPAHIFSRLGMWKEALASCQSAWDVSQSWVERKHLSTDKRDYHSLQWIVLIDVERGQLRAAEAAVQRFLDGARQGSDGLRSWYTAVLTDYLRGTGQWSRLDELMLAAPDNDAAATATAGPACHGPAQPRHDHWTLATLEARRQAAVARHDAGEVERLNAAIAGLRKRTASEEEKRMGPVIFARWMQEESLGDAALLAAAKGDDVTAGARWQSRAELEDRDPPDEGADALGGAHFLAGEAWLRAGRAADARRELERSLLRYPAHVASLAALGRACDKLGDAAAARAAFTGALAFWRDADADFAPAHEARAWLDAHAAKAAR